MITCDCGSTFSD